MIAAVVAMVVYAAGDAGQALLVKPIVDKTLVLGTGVTLIAWGIVGVYLLKGIGSYISSYLMTGVGQRVVMDIRNALYRHILGQSAGFFALRAHGQLMSRIGNDVSQVQQAVSETIGDLARESLTAVVLAGYLFYVDPRLTLFCLFVAPLIIYPLVLLGWRVRRTTRRSQEALEHLSHLSAEAFTGHRIVKAFGTEQHETDKFSRAAYGLFRTNMKVTAALSSLTTGAAVTDSSGDLAPTASTSSSYAQAASACAFPSAAGCTVAAQLVKSVSNSSAGAAGASSNDSGTQLVGVTIQGTTVPLDPAPNQRVDIPNVGYVIFNEQFCDNNASLANHCADGTGAAGLTVRAIHVFVTVPNNPLGLKTGEVIVAEAHSDAMFRSS